MFCAIWGAILPNTACRKWSRSSRDIRLIPQRSPQFSRHWVPMKLIFLFSTPTPPNGVTSSATATHSPTAVGWSLRLLWRRFQRKDHAEPGGCGCVSPGGLLRTFGVLRMEYLGGTVAWSCRGGNWLEGYILKSGTFGQLCHF